MVVTLADSTKQHCLRNNTYRLSFLHCCMDTGLKFSRRELLPKSGKVELEGEMRHAPVLIDQLGGQISKRKSTRDRAVGQSGLNRENASGWLCRTATLSCQSSHLRGRKMAPTLLPSEGYKKITAFVVPSSRLLKLSDSGLSSTGSS